MKKQSSLLHWASMYAAVLVACVAFGLFAQAAEAPDTADTARDFYFLDVTDGKGPLSLPKAAFDHDQHIEALDSECSACHLEVDGEFSEKYLQAETLTGSALKNMYHDTCIGCHVNTMAESKKTGPLDADCRACHQAQPGAASGPLSIGLFQSMHEGDAPAVNKLYTFLTGTGLYIALAVFVLGLVARLVMYFVGLDWQLDRVAYKTHFGMGMKGGLFSIFKWLLPYGTVGWRTHPVFTAAFFLFHIGVILVMFFLVGHNEIFQMKLGFSLPTLDQSFADVVSIAALAGLGFILVRRFMLPEVRILTTAHDYFIIALVAVPLLTGILARFGAGAADGWLLLHIISGELMLILAPFTKLSHIVLYFGSRWQLGADFSIKRGGHRRGPYFPW